VLAVRSLTKRFGRTVAVQDLSFEVPPGRIVGFLGPNGAGKTTTLRALLGLCVPTSGEATIDGQRYTRLRDPVKVVGAVLDGPQFHPGRTGRNHLRVVACAAGLPESRVGEVLRIVELEGAAADRRVKGYSLGMRQRLSLATALLGDPRALILDEPANGLDPQGIRWLRDLLRALGDEGRTILVSSHVLAEVAQTVDEVVVIDRGRHITTGPVDQLTGGVRPQVLVRSPEAERLASALAAKGIETERLSDGALIARNTSGEAIGTTAAEATIALYELTPQGSSLEDVFLELTGGASR
jgi:ABC-2 type transport system ATP-binding protein